MCCLVSRSRQEVDADVPLSCCSHRKRAKVFGGKSSLGFLLLLFLKVVVVIVVAKQFRCSIAGVDLVPPLSKRGKRGKGMGAAGHLWREPPAPTSASRTARWGRRAAASRSCPGWQHGWRCTPPPSSTSLGPVMAPSYKDCKPASLIFAQQFLTSTYYDFLAAQIFHSNFSLWFSTWECVVYEKSWLQTSITYLTSRHALASIKIIHKLWFEWGNVSNCLADFFAFRSFRFLFLTTEIVSFSLPDKQIANANNSAVTHFAGNISV